MQSSHWSDLSIFQLLCAVEAPTEAQYADVCISLPGHPIYEQTLIQSFLLHPYFQNCANRHQKVELSFL